MYLTEEIFIKAFKFNLIFSQMNKEEDDHNDGNQTDECRVSMISQFRFLSFFLFVVVLLI